MFVFITDTLLMSLSEVGCILTLIVSTSSFNNYISIEFFFFDYSCCLGFFVLLYWIERASSAAR